MTDPITQSMMQGSAGAAGGGDLYVDDVFHIQTHLGTSVARTINNGIDLSGEGGLLWARTRNKSFEHTLFDTVRSNGRTYFLATNSSGIPVVYNGNGITSFNNNGYSLGDDTQWGGVNYSGQYGTYEHVLTTFRKAPNFFDIVTYTGNGNSSRNIAHNLGSIPGFIIVKRLDTNADWSCYHRQMNLTGYSYLPANYYLRLNANAGWASSSNMWNQTMPTANHFTVGDNGNVNANGGEYIAYIFAHNDGNGGFGGNTGTDGDIIQCSRYAGNGSTYKKVTVGWEPQYVLIKNIGDSGSGSTWLWYDQMRTAGRQDMYLNELRVDTTDLEQDGAGYDSQPIITFDSEGFTLLSNSGYSNYNNHDYMYVAIRRPDGYVGKPPLAGTDVFGMARGQGGNSQPNYPGGIVVDYHLTRDTDSANNFYTGARLIGNEYLQTNVSATHGDSTTWVYDYMTGYNSGSSGNDWQSWQWKRHAGMDVVAYRGNSGSGRTVRHNLAQTPEMIWIKCRGSATENWVVGHKGLNGGTNPWEYSLRLNTNDTEIDYPYFNDTAPTSTHFTLNNNGQVNGGSSNHYVAMLFASVEGICKVGYYTGNLTTGHAITTGFQPRFLMIKSATQTWDWFVVDTTRGFASGDDKILKLNDLAAQTQWNFANPTATGFELHADGAINGNGEKYIYYAHA